MIKIISILELLLHPHTFGGLPSPPKSAFSLSSMENKKQVAMISPITILTVKNLRLPVHRLIREY